MEKCLTDQRTDNDTTRATASLPRLGLSSSTASGKTRMPKRFQLICQAVPSFEAFGRFIETANPFAGWAQVARMAWVPWLGGTKALMLPWSGGQVRANSSGSPDATNERRQR